MSDVDYSRTSVVIESVLVFIWFEDFDRVDPLGAYLSCPLLFTMASCQYSKVLSGVSHVSVMNITPYESCVNPLIPSTDDTGFVPFSHISPSQGYDKVYPEEKYQPKYGEGFNPRGVLLPELLTGYPDRLTSCGGSTDNSFSSLGSSPDRSGNQYFYVKDLSLRYFQKRKKIYTKTCLIL